MYQLKSHLLHTAPFLWPPAHQYTSVPGQADPHGTSATSAFHSVWGTGNAPRPCSLQGPLAHELGSLQITTLVRRREIMHISLHTLFLKAIIHHVGQLHSVFASLLAITFWKVETVSQLHTGAQVSPPRQCLVPTACTGSVKTVRICSAAGAAVH